MEADKVKYRPMNDLEDPGLAPLVPTAEQASQVREQLVQVKSYLESRGVRHNLSNFLKVGTNSRPRGVGHNIDNFLKVFRAQIDTTALYRFVPCYYGWLSLVISPDGMIYPCSRGFDSLGNVHEQDFREIWHGEAYRKFREEAITLNRRKAPVRGCDCNSCSHYNLNLRAYKSLHPIRGRSAQINELRPTVLDDPEE